jgi:hypothetical protein
VSFAGRVVADLPPQSVFPGRAAASSFFSLGATGYSATRVPNHYHGMELRSLHWSVDAMDVTEHFSSLLQIVRDFPPVQSNWIADC